MSSSCHLVQVEHEPRAVPLDLGLELLQVLRLDAADQPQGGGLTVGRRLDPKCHLQEPAAMCRREKQAPRHG